MKTNKLKKAMTAIMLLANMTLGNTLRAEEFTIPAISSPEILKEGTQRELSAAQVAELLPWAKNSKIYIKDLLEQINNLPMDQKIESLTNGLKQAVLDSAPKNSELIMRYSLNRAFVVIETLDREMDENVPGTLDAKARVLIRSAEFALKYSDADIQSLSSKATLPFADFGKDYFNFLHDLNKSIFDASAQYMVQKMALEFFQWDLYRDLNNKVYAPQITKINSTLVRFPKEAPVQDSKSIAYIRQLKVLIAQLDMNLGKGEVVTKKEEGGSVDTLKIAMDIANNLLNKPETRRAVGNFSAYGGKCYASDRNGSFILSEEFDADRCAVKYLSYSGKCRALDKNDNYLMSKEYDADRCAVKFLSYGGKCRALDMNDNYLMSKEYDAERCAVKYLSYGGKCRALDQNDTYLMSKEYDADRCAVKFLSYSGKCRALDQNDNYLMSKEYDAERCAVKYLSYGGKCRGLDMNDNYLMSKEYDADRCAASFGMYGDKCRAIDANGNYLMSKEYANGRCY